MTAQPSRGTIVVVEDQFVFGFLRLVLERKGFEVVRVETEGCLDFLRSAQSGGVSLVITNRPSIFKEFADTVPLLYIAALPDPEAAQPFRAIRVLRKPFHPDQLISCVEQLLR
jgi:DNA-binding response OmpR family regulator